MSDLDGSDLDGNDLDGNDPEGRDPEGEDLQAGRRSGLLPRFQVLAAALLFSTGGVAVKASALSDWQVASYRSGVAVGVVLLAVALGWVPRPRIDGRTWLVALAYAATLILYVASNKRTTAASAIFLQSTAPLYVLLLGPWLLREGIRRREVIYMAILGLGLGCFFTGFDPASATAPDPVGGNVVGALSGVTWALTLVGLRWLGRAGIRGAGADLGAVICGNLVAFAAALPGALAPEALPISSWSGGDWTVVLYLGAFQVAGAYFFLTAGIRRLPALDASLLLLLDPVLSPVWAFVVHDEALGPWTVVGGAVVLSATLVKTWLDARRPA